MDYNKIGAFITSERKNKKLTQAKLAEKIFVSEKTISKWENGGGVPDTHTLPKLCEVFEVSVNELLNGERISQEEYSSKAESKLLELQKTKEESAKNLLKVEIILGLIGTISFFTILFASIYMIEKLNIIVLPIILICISLAIFIVAMLYCLIIEQKAGYYVCDKCQHKYVPSFAAVLLARHLNRSRYMKCPHCHQKSYHKKVIK